MALTAVSALEKLGYRVPNDVIVTGFDCTYNARNFTPSLTTVKRPLTMAGKTACATLAEIFSGGNPEKIITLDAHAVFAESCGCKDSSSDDFIEYKKNTYNHLESINTNLSLLNRLTAALADTETSEELFDSIEELVEELGCEKFSLCLTEGWQDAFENISDGENNDRSPDLEQWQTRKRGSFHKQADVPRGIRVGRKHQLLPAPAFP